jgi:predicted transcriptional regulator YdeE
MSNIVKVYKETVPALRFIGKKYGDSDRVNGSFGAKWHEWFSNGWFGTLEKQYDGNLKDVFENSDSYIGLMRDDIDGIFEYWIGMFLPEGTTVPDGFASIEFPAGNLGVCWIFGKESEVFMHEGECADRLKAEGFGGLSDWCFERYVCPRFTDPDSEGRIILDICFYIE